MTPEEEAGILAKRIREAADKGEPLLLDAYEVDLLAQVLRALSDRNR